MSKYEEYINGQSPAIRNICKEVIDNCIADSAKYYIEVFLEVFEKRGISFEFRLNETPEFIKMVREIGRYIYSVNRLKVLLALARRGLINRYIWERLVNFPSVNVSKCTYP